MYCEIIPKLGIIRVTKRISAINYEGLIIHDESWFVQCVLLLKGFTSMQFLPLHFARFLGISVLVSLMGVFPSLVAAESNELRPYTNNPVVAIVDDEPVILQILKAYIRNIKENSCFAVRWFGGPPPPPPPRLRL